LDIWKKIYGVGGLGQKTFFEARVPNHKKAYTEEQKNGDAGPYMEVMVQAYIPFGSVNNHLRMDIMKYHRYILLLQRPDGTVRVIGNKGNCAYFSHNEDLGESFRNVPGTAIKFHWTNEDKPLLYTLALPV